MMYECLTTLSTPWPDPSEGVSPSSLLSAGPSTPQSERRRSSILSAEYDLGLSSNSSATASLPRTPTSEQYNFKFLSRSGGNSGSADPRTPRVCGQDTSVWPFEWYTTPPAKPILRSPFTGMQPDGPQRSTMSLHTSFDTDPGTYLSPCSSDSDLQFTSFSSLDSSQLSDFGNTTYLGTPYDSFSSSTSTEFSSFDSPPATELHNSTPRSYSAVVLPSTPGSKYTSSTYRARVDQSSFASLGQDRSSVLPSEGTRQALRRAQKKGRRKSRRNGRSSTFLTTNGIEIEDQSTPTKASRQKYPCDTCDRSFARNEHLKRHKNSKCCYDKDVKEQTKNYECALHCLRGANNKPLCIKKFNNRRDNRQQHHVTHLGCKTGKSKTSPGISPKMLRRMLYIQEREARNEDGEFVHDHAAAVKTVQQVHRHLLNKLSSREIALCKPEAAADELIRQYTEDHVFSDGFVDFDGWDYDLTEFFNARF